MVKSIFNVLFMKKNKFEKFYFGKLNQFIFLFLKII